MCFKQFNKYKMIMTQDFPSGPVGKTPSFHCRGHGFNPWSGNYDPSSLNVRPKEKTVKKKKKKKKWLISPGAVLCTSIISFNLYKNPVVIPILQLRKQKFREVKALASGRARSSVKPVNSSSLFSVTNLCSLCQALC